MPFPAIEPELQLPIRAAIQTAVAHGVIPDRCEILQNGNTLVLRLTETLVARVLQDRNGPRQGTEWFARETAIVQHLSRRNAPVIPLHPDLPPGPHVHLGYPMNFWEFVTRVDREPDPVEIGQTLRQCHVALHDFSSPLAPLAILAESLQILQTAERFEDSVQELLRRHLEESIEVLSSYPHRPLHGDAHPGNLMVTTRGLLWTDWEDAFSGPVEWDLASIIWNARILEEDHATADAILDAYQKSGGQIAQPALQQSLIARAAVMSAWYPILYPNPDASRRAKLQRRLDWLAEVRS